MAYNLTNHDFRVLFLYEWKMGHNAQEAARNINYSFGKDSANARTIRRWFDKFKSGDLSMTNCDRGRPKTAIVDKELQAAVELNSRQSVRELSKQFDVCARTISTHLKAIGKVKKMEQWVPHLLSNSQKTKRLEICKSLLLRHEEDPFLNRIITSDEKWVLYHNRRRSAQWLNVDEAPSFCAKPDLHPKKIMITVWWSMAGVVHYSFLEPGETITADKYCSELEQMHQKLSIQQPSLVNRKGILLLHDNARPHVSKKTLQKLSELNIEVLKHPPYSPDLAPTDFHLFKHLDHVLSQKTFADHEGVKKAISDFINSRDEDFYANGIRKLVSRWEKCCTANGDYFI